MSCDSFQIPSVNHSQPLTIPVSSPVPPDVTRNCSSEGGLAWCAPAERQQRLADEVAGKRRRAVNADPEADPEAIEEARKKRRYDEEIRKGVDEYTVGLHRFG